MTQVSDSTKTLLDAIRDGDVPRPGLMRWNAWQTWRRGEGRRPLVSRDGVTTSNAEESALRKSVIGGTEQLKNQARQSRSKQEAPLQCRARHNFHNIASLLTFIICLCVGNDSLGERRDLVLQARGPNAPLRKGATGERIVAQVD